jgi:hypothetical protein
MKNMKNMKKCPPGVICLENATMLFIIIALGAIALFIWNKQSSQLNGNTRTINQTFMMGEQSPDSANEIRFRPNVAYNNAPNDVLLNPYAPPLRDERYMVSDNTPRRGVPINVSTSIDAVDTEYRQLGLLTPMKGETEGKMLPLMGRPLFVSRDKWQYYTMSEQRNSIKLPISKNGRSATTEYGVDKLFDGDTVFVEGYNQPFKVTTYDNDVMRYIPFI